MQQYCEYILTDTTGDGGPDRQDRFIEAINALEGYSKLAALDKAYQEAISFNDKAVSYDAKNLIDTLTASIIHVRDMLLDERH